MKTTVISCVMALLSSAALAQAPAASSTPNTDLKKLGYVSAADIAAGLKKLPQDRADISMRIFQIPPYNVNAAHRAPVTQVANVHDAQTELFMVLDGTGSIVWGGTVVGATRNGGNIAGKSIDGGTTQKLGKGADGLQLMQLYLPRTQ